MTPKPIRIKKLLEAKDSAVRSVLLSLILCFFLVIPARAQVEISCAPTPAKASRAIFDKRSSEVLQHWTVELKNLGDAEASVSEAEIIGWMIRQGAVVMSSQTVRVGSESIKSRGPLKTVGRVLPLAAMLTTGLLATDGIQISEDWIKGLVSFGTFALPEIGSRLSARPPDISLFDQLALGGQQIGVPARSSVLVNIFGAKGDYGNLSGLLRPGELEIISYNTSNLWTQAVWGD